MPQTDSQHTATDRASPTCPNPSPRARVRVAPVDSRIDAHTRHDEAEGRTVALRATVVEWLGK